MLLIFAMPFFLCTNLAAQNLVNSTVPDHSPYVGTWIGIEGSDSLIVQLELMDLYFEPYGRSFKVLYGTHSYESDSKIENEGQKKYDHTLRHGLLNKENSPSHIKFLFIDEVLNKTGHLRLLIDKENDDKLEWRLSNGEMLMINLTQAEIEERKRFSVPTEMTLYRMD